MASKGPDGGTHRHPDRAKVRANAHHDSLEVDRRWLLGSGGVALFVGGALGWTQGLRGEDQARPGRVPLRPPGAIANEDLFRAACIRCGLCGINCENGCIRFFDADDQEHGPSTPFLDVRRRSCTLCMRCTQVCPSGALSPIAKEPAVILEQVRIGKAVVNPEHCLSYLGRLCGYCHDACPIPEQAIRLTPPALPVVMDGCVGCGRCVELCPQSPTAIEVERAT